jgi:putative peptidoglycan lipid II flippase
VRAFHARRNTRTPFYLNLFENALNVALVVPLVALFDSTGLSTAYSIAYWVAAGTALVVLNRHVPGLIQWPWLRPLGRSLLVAAAVLVWVAVAATYIDVDGALAQVLVTVAVGVVAFVAATLLARPPGFEPIADRVGGLVRRRR